MIPEVNGVPGLSLFDVHKRLNVNCNSCPFPAGYQKTSGIKKTPAGIGNGVGEGFLSITPNCRIIDFNPNDRETSRSRGDLQFPGKENRDTKLRQRDQCQMAARQLPCGRVFREDEFEMDNGDGEGDSNEQVSTGQQLTA